MQAPSSEVLEAVRGLGLEGVVGKRIDSIYEPGERSGVGIKLRTNLEQEFVVGGYIPGARGFDALLVGVYEKKRLIFLAKVTYVAAKLSLADHLAKGPRGADELADSITGQCLTGFIMSQNRSAIAVEAEKCRGSLDGRTTP